MSDKYDEQAERLLPCSMLAGCTNVSDTHHNRDCIIWKRPTVAAILREQGRQLADIRAELERTQTALGQAQADLMGCRDGALVRDLRARLEDCHACWDNSLLEAAKYAAMYAALKSKLEKL